MKLFILSIQLVLLSFASIAAASSNKGGDQTLEFHSSILNENQNIEIIVPKDYEKSNSRYPVLYLLDGNLNASHAKGANDLLSMTGHIAPLIIVAITSNDRTRDMTISRDQNYAKNSGGGDSYLDFIEKELMPFVNKNYQTNGFEIIEGHSLGGLLAAHSLLARPNLFDAYIVISPALWWDGERVIKGAKKYLNRFKSLDKSVYFGIGTEDGWGMRQEHKRFVAILDENTPNKLRYAYREFENEGHMSAPYLVNYHGLKHTFSDINYPKEKWQQFDENEFTQYEKNIEEKYGSSIKQTNENYYALADFLVTKRNLTGAIAVLERCAEQYPDYYGNFAKLAQAYELHNNAELAIVNYRKAYDTATKGGEVATLKDDLLKNIHYIKNPISKATLARYLGRYESKERKFTIASLGTKLIVKLDDGGEFYLYHETDSLFYVPFSQTKLEFVQENGQTKLLMHRLDRSITLEKVK